jgi:hypothetical protein
MANKLVFRASVSAAGAPALGLYNPPPTDAVLLNPDGSVNGPANPDLFSSADEAHALVHDLVQHHICKKPQHFHHILDEPFTESGTVRYGQDGRKILVLVFLRDGQHFANNVQELFIELKRLPSPGSVWAIEPGAGGIDFLIRKGAVVGAA